jgi:hypothetical protein
VTSVRQVNVGRGRLRLPLPLSLFSKLASFTLRPLCLSLSPRLVPRVQPTRRFTIARPVRTRPLAATTPNALANAAMATRIARDFRS